MDITEWFHSSLLHSKNTKRKHFSLSYRQVKIHFIVHRRFGFWESQRMRETSSEPVNVSPPLPSVTSMNLLSIAIFKSQPSFLPSDETVIILHLHDKCVCLCTHLRMYVWALKRTLGAAGHEFPSFISGVKGGKRPFFF